MSEPKGRPTPKRSAAQKRRSRPVGPPPTDRKAAAKRLREETKARRAQAREGAARGDDRFLTSRDAGPVRRVVRDVVDGRRNVAPVVLPLALLLVVGQMSGPGPVLDVVLTLWTVGLAAFVGDCIVLGVRIRRAVRERFPDEDRTRGHVVYGILRSTQFRRIRLPKPGVAVGEPPRKD